MAENPEQTGGANTPLQMNQAARLPHSNTDVGRCSHCGADIPPGAGACPVCGERLYTKPHRVRCRQCGQTASSQLVICPHCGRELRPAAPRSIAWGIPLMMAVLLLALLVIQWERLNFFGTVQEKTGAAVAWLTAWGESLDPQIAVAPVAGLPEQITAGELAVAAGAAGINGAVEPQVEIIPSAPLNTVPVTTTILPTATNTQAVTVAVTPPPTETPAPLPTATPLPPPTPTDTPAPTLTETPTQAPTETPTETPPQTPSQIPTQTSVATPMPVASNTPTSTPTQSPTLANSTATASATKAGIGVVAGAARANAEAAAITVTASITIATPDASLLPSPTPTAVGATALVLPTATPGVELPPATATPIIYVVQAGDTTMGIAQRFRVPVADLIAINGFTAEEARLLRPGQQLVIPGAQANPPENAIPTPTTAAAAARYTVRSGDTIIAIASRMGATVEGILAANSMTEADARAIRPGDELLIPGPGATIALPTATPVSESSLTPTQTPTRPPPTLTPTATPVALRLSAPVLLSPESGAAASCAVPDKLVWSPVQFVKDTDRYRLNLGYVGSRDAAGNPMITWVIQQLQPAGLTQWNMDVSLCALAPQEMGRQWRWYVDVVETVNGAVVPVSPPSEIWGFSWN